MSDSAAFPNRIPADQAVAQSAQTILLIDAEQPRGLLLVGALRQAGYQVLITSDGPTAVLITRRAPPDLIILSLALLDSWGGAGWRIARGTGITPVLLIPASPAGTRPAGLMPLGPQDYLAGSDQVPDLLAEVARLLEVNAQDLPAGRAPPPIAPAARLLVSGELIIDLGARTVVRAGQRVALKPREFDLLAFLAQHPGRVFSRPALLEQVWGPAACACARTVDVHVRWLRTKLESVPAQPQIIQTAYRVGYKFGPPVQTRPR